MELPQQLTITSFALSYGCDCQASTWRHLSTEGFTRSEKLWHMKKMACTTWHFQWWLVEAKRLEHKLDPIILAAEPAELSAKGELQYQVESRRSWSQRRYHNSPPCTETHQETANLGLLMSSIRPKASDRDHCHGTTKKQWSKVMRKWFSNDIPSIASDYTLAICSLALAP